jgi:hypothetical protein
MMARFYGFSALEIEEMDIDSFNNYLENIEEVRGREMLLMLDVVSYPHADKDSKNKIIKKFQRTQEKKQVTTKDLGSIFQGMVKNVR